MLKYKRFRLIAMPLHGAAAHHAIFDIPAGNTSWEVMSRSFGRTTPEERVRILQRVICFFDF